MYLNEQSIYKPPNLILTVESETMHVSEEVYLTGLCWAISTRAFKKAYNRWYLIPEKW